GARENFLVRLRELAGFPGVKQGAMSEHVQRRQRLQSAFLLDLAGRADQLADEGIGTEEEAVLLLVVITEDGPHVLQIAGVRQALDRALVGIQDAAQAKG